MRLAQIVVSTIAVAALAACSTADLRDEEIAGAYAAVVAGETSRIELHADGTATWVSLPISDDQVRPEDLDDPESLDFSSGEGTWVSGLDMTTALDSRRGVRLLVDGEVMSAVSVARGWFGLVLERGLCDPDVPACTITYVSE